MSINISPDTSNVIVQSTANTVTVIDTANSVNVSTSQPVTSVITVAIPGPQGATGEIPSTGSFATTGSNSFTGNQIITGSLTVSGSSTFTNIGPAAFSGSVGSTQGFTGSLQGTASFATSASHAQGYVLNSSTSSFITNSQTGSYASTGSVTFTGSQIVTGSTRGNVTVLTISSNTASVDLSVGNFFTLQLVSGSNTHINPSNILPGQTSLLTLSTTGSATVSFPSSVKQPSGSAYIPTTSTGVDILTFVSVDSSTLYVANIKNMI
jgi:hypothetical protein